MRQYTIQQLTQVALRDTQLARMSSYATAQSGENVWVLSVYNGDSCFTRQEFSKQLSINLGDKFYTSVFDESGKVSVVDSKDKYIHIATVMYGAYYHELFHVLYTPFEYVSSLMSKTPYGFTEFLGNVLNILEDIYIESRGAKEYPFADQYLKAVAESFSLPSSISSLKESIESDPDNPGTMLGYLLHYLRGVDMTKLPKYSYFENNKEFLKWASYKCINTLGAELRVKRQEAFAYQLAKIMMMKSPSKSEIDDPDSTTGKESIAKQMSKKDLSGPGMKSISVIRSSTDITDTRVRNSNSILNTSKEDVEDLDKLPEPQSSQKASFDSTSGRSSSPVTADLVKEAVTMLANNVPVTRTSHVLVNLSKVMNTRSYLSDYESVKQAHKAEISQVIRTVRRLKGQNNSSWNHYQNKGRLDMATVWKPHNLKLFKTHNAPKEEADLVAYLLMDASGSMCGTKALYAGKAAITLSESLNALKYPFNVSAFSTLGSAAVTTVLKDFSQPYDSCKTNLTLFTKQFDCYAAGTWSANLDEINLRYAFSVLNSRPEKDKVLIVLSDGATCGSKDTLAKMIKLIEKSGITVLGIGIYDRNVEDLYTHHTIIRNQDDLKGLPAFLNKYLVRKIFR